MAEFDVDAYVPQGPWDENPDAWNVLELGGEDWPGFAHVEVSRANKWDDKKAKGSHKGDRELSGVDNATVKIRIKFWSSEQYARLTDLMPMIEPTPGKKKIDALAISHAVTILRKVGHVTIDSVAGPTYAPGELGELVIDATEHQPPETKNATGKAGKGGGAPYKGETNCEALSREYAQATSDAASLEGQKAQATSAYYSTQGDWGQSDSTASARKQQFDQQMGDLNEQQKNAYNRQQNASSQMQAQGCNSAKPSGNSAVTNP